MILQKHIFDFLRDLKTNNNRDWFEANRPRYQEARKDFERYLKNLIPQIAAFDKTVANLTAKQAMFRIFRDVRFSKDKTPYKPNFGAALMKGGRKSYFAGYYLHIEAGNSFLGGGMYMPESPVLKAVREEIYYNPAKFKSLISSPEFKKLFTELYGEKLKTAPKGYDKDFEYIDLLRYKSYTMVHNVDDETITSKDFTHYALEIFKAMVPVNHFLNEAAKDVDSTQLRCK